MTSPFISSPKKDYDYQRYSQNYIDFISNTINCAPVAHVDQFKADKLRSAGLFEEISVGGSAKIIKVTGCPTKQKTLSILLRGFN